MKKETTFELERTEDEIRSSERHYDDDGRRTVKKEIGLRITEQEGGKRLRNGAREIDFDREEQRGITDGWPNEIFIRAEVVRLKSCSSEECGKTL